MNHRSTVKHPGTPVPGMSGTKDCMNSSLPHLSTFSHTVEDSFCPLSNSVIDRDEESILKKNIPSKDITILGKECNDISWFVSDVSLFQTKNASKIPDCSFLDRNDESIFMKRFPNADITMNGKECSNISWRVTDVSLFQTNHNSTIQNNPILESEPSDKTFNMPVEKNTRMKIDKLVPTSKESQNLVKKSTDPAELAEFLCKHPAFVSPKKKKKKRIQERPDIKVPSVERILEHLNSNNVTDMSESQIIQGILDLTVEDDPDILHEDITTTLSCNNSAPSSKRDGGLQIGTTVGSSDSIVSEPGEMEPPWISDFNRLMEQIEAFPGSLTSSTILDKLLD